MASIVTEVTEGYKTSASTERRTIIGISNSASFALRYSDCSHVTSQLKMRESERLRGRIICHTQLSCYRPSLVKYCDVHIMPTSDKFPILCNLMSDGSQLTIKALTRGQTDDRFSNFFHPMTLNFDR